MIVIEKWPGLVTNASPYAIPPGAAVTQVNAQVLSPGMLTVRDGLTGVQWSSHTAAATTQAASEVWRAFRAPCSGTERIIYQNAAGQVRIAVGS